MTMRLCVALLFCLFLVAPAYAQSRQTDRDEDGLKGKVKAVLEEDAKLSGEPGKLIEGKRLPSSAAEYDAEGNATRLVFNRADGSVHFTINFKFIEGVKTSTSTYEDRGPVLVAVSPPAPASQQAPARPKDPRFEARYVYKYDGRGRRVEEARYESDGDLWINTVRTFDEAGRLIESARYAKDGRLLDSKKVVYDKGGQEAEVTYFDDKGSVREKNTFNGYELDAKGNWVRREARRWVSGYGVTRLDSHHITYRKITYY